MNAIITLALRVTAFLPISILPMKHAILLTSIFLFAFLTRSDAAEANDAIFTQRRDTVLREIEARPGPSPEKNIGFKQHMALLHFFRNEKLEEANRMVLDFCANPFHVYRGKVLPRGFSSSALFRIYLLEGTRKLLTKEAREAIEDNAWGALTKYPLGMSRATVDKAELAHFLLPNNGMTDKWRGYYLALLIVRQAERYGPKAMLEGDTIENHCRAWERFWLTFFHTFPNEGTDMDIAHPTSYSAITTGVWYDLYDLAADPEVRELAGKFLTLFWAEVAAEFEPRIGERAGMATTRHPVHTGQAFWARRLLYCYQWHDNNEGGTALELVPSLTSAYRPPPIVVAIAQDANRGCYQTTSRRPGMISGDGVEVTYTTYRGDIKGNRIIMDRNGNSHFRRDVYYTPDYALGTLTSDPKRQYISDVILTPMMGATFATGYLNRIVVMGTGSYPVRPTSGITGKAVSIIARDPNAKFGHGRHFESDGTRVYISNGELWNNRVEHKSGWFFTRAGDAYAAIRPSAGGYHITDKSYSYSTWDAVPKVSEVAETKGQFLELNDMWAPIVIQMGRTEDYKSFEDFQTSVKANRFEYQDGKLTYVSNAKEKFEYWAKGAQPPRINDITVNLNPPKTFDSPYLSMVHGSSKAVITYPGHKELVLDFSPNKQTPEKSTSSKR